MNRTIIGGLVAALALATAFVVADMAGWKGVLALLGLGVFVLAGLERRQSPDRHPDRDQ